MKVMRLLMIALGLIVFATGCQQVSTAKAVNTTDKTYAIYTFADAVTGAKVDLATGDTATIQYKSSAGKVVTLSETESDYGVIDLTNDQVIVYNYEKADNFILTLTKTGYKAFEGRALFPGDKVVDSYGVYNQDETANVVFYDSVLYPSTIPYSTQAINITVRNANTKAAVTSGSYTVKLTTGTVTDITDPTVTDGTIALYQYIPAYTSLGSTGGQYQGYTLSGSVSATGTITIPAGSLFSGQGYTVAVKGASGYATGSATFTDGATTSTGLYIDLVPAYGTPAESISNINLVGTNNINSTGNLIKGVRTILLTFDKAIEVNYTSLLNTSLSTNITMTTTDTDLDTTVNTKATLAAATGGNLPSGLTISASGQTLTITLPIDSVLLATEDTGDALSWDITNIFNKINVRPVNATTYTLLSNFTAYDPGTPALTGCSKVTNGLSTSTAAGYVGVGTMESIFVR